MARQDEAAREGREQRRFAAEGEPARRIEPVRSTPRAESPADPQRSWHGLLRRHPLLLGGAIVLVAAAVALATLWWLQSLTYVSTNDAFIDTRPAPISSQVNGAVVEVPVTDNELVKPGAVLVRIDERDYRAAFEQAKAQVEQATANIANSEAQIAEQDARIEQAQKLVKQAQAALKFAEEENARYQDLVQKGAGTLQRAQQAGSELQQAEANFASNQAALTAAQKQVGVLNTQRQSAIAQREAMRASEQQAAANLARTTIRAPFEGRVTRLTAAKGQYAQIGQTLMMFVPLQMWVTANFKETALTDMRPGQPASISIDAYPGRSFAGHVDSLQAGTGTVFSLLPAENATGNYVKVVQRVPVKIVFNQQPDVFIGPGMSVVPTVKVK